MKKAIGRRPLKALIIEDYEDDVVLVVRELRRGGFDVRFERVEDPAAMRAALANGPWDIVISDYSMPHFSGLDALKILRESGLDVPFLLMSGSTYGSQARQAIEHGAVEYLTKENLSDLVPAVDRVLSRQS